MGQNVAELLIGAVSAFNARVYQAKEDGLPFIIETTASAERGSGGGDHVYVRRTMPMAAHVLPEARDRQCAAEVALFSAAGEINRLADEARRREVALRLKIEAAGEPANGKQILIVLSESTRQ